MSLYQRVAYITPSGSISVDPQVTWSSALGPSLFARPGSWQYNTYAGPGCYGTLDQGLIAFMASDSLPPWGTPYNDGGYRVVTKADGSMDALPFMQAMAALCSYGTTDEGQTLAALQSLARTRPLELRCGPTTDFVRGCAAGVGLQTREVHLLTATAPTNFDDGHVATEVSVGGAWQMYDVANDLAWIDSAGKVLSLNDVIAAGLANCLPVKLATTRCGRAVYPSQTCWLSSFHHMTMETPDQVQTWCQRIYQMPGITHADGLIYFYTPPGTEARAAWVSSLSPAYRVVSYATWLSMFY